MICQTGFGEFKLNTNNCIIVLYNLPAIRMLNCAVFHSVSAQLALRILKTKYKGNLSSANKKREGSLFQYFINNYSSNSDSENSLEEGFDARSNVRN